MVLRRLALGVAVLAAVGVARRLEAQDWQVIAQSRQARSESNLQVSVRFASGHVTLKPGLPGALYQTEMRYDANDFVPNVRYDASSRRLRVSLSTDDTDADIDVDTDSPQRLLLTLPRDIPVNLNMELGATASDIELGGVALEQADIKIGASEATISFSESNPIACERFEVVMGAAQLYVDHLGNAGCARVEVTGGVGELTIDLTGSWFAEGSSLAVKVGLGQVTLRIPRSLGVRVELDRLLAGFDRAGFVRRGSSYLSRDYDGAQAKLDITIHAVFGDVDVVWLDEQQR